jgi:hypothetical protein
MHCVAPWRWRATKREAWRAADEVGATASHFGGELGWTSLCSIQTA